MSEQFTPARPAPEPVAFGHRPANDLAHAHIPDKELLAQMKAWDDDARRTPQEALRHHVTGAIERGEATPVVEKPGKDFDVPSAKADAINAAIKAAGFNYGTGNTAPTPHEYDAVEKLLGHWNTIKAEVDRTSWALEMALRDWRLAETDDARARALAGLVSLRDAVPAVTRLERRETVRP